MQRKVFLAVCPLFCLLLLFGCVQNGPPGQTSISAIQTTAPPPSTAATMAKDLPMEREKGIAFDAFPTGIFHVDAPDYYDAEKQGQRLFHAGTRADFLALFAEEHLQGDGLADSPYEKDLIQSDPMLVHAQTMFTDEFFERYDVFVYFEQGYRESIFAKPELIAMENGTLTVYLQELSMYVDPYGRGEKVFLRATVMILEKGIYSGETLRATYALYENKTLQNRLILRGHGNEMEYVWAHHYEVFEMQGAAALEKYRMPGNTALSLILHPPPLPPPPPLAPGEIVFDQFSHGNTIYMHNPVTHENGEILAVVSTRGELEALLGESIIPGRDVQEEFAFSDVVDSHRGPLFSLARETFTDAFFEENDVFVYAKQAQWTYFYVEGQHLILADGKLTLYLKEVRIVNYEHPSDNWNLDLIMLIFPKGHYNGEMLAASFQVLGQEGEENRQFIDGADAEAVRAWDAARIKQFTKIQDIFENLR